MRIFLIVMWALIAMSSNAQGISQLIERKIQGAPIPNSEIRMVADIDSERTNMRSAQSQTPLKEEAHRVPVRIHFPLDDEWVMIGYTIQVYNEEGYSENLYVDTSVDYADVELPEGKYDMSAEFMKRDFDDITKYSPSVLYIVEDIVIEPEMDIYFCPWESTICLKMETYNPKGEKNRFSKIKFTEWNDVLNWWNSEVVEEGNIESVFIIKQVFYNEQTLRTSRVSMDASVEPGVAGYFDAEPNCNIYVNRVSDKYQFRAYQITRPSSRDELYLTVTEGSAKEGIYSNSNNWINEHTGIAHSSSFTENEDDYTLYVYPMQHSKITLRGDIVGLNSQMAKNIWYSGPANDDSNEIYMCYSKGLIESGIIDDKFISTMTGTSAYYPLVEAGKVVSALQPNGFVEVIPEHEVLRIPSYPFNNFFNSTIDDILLEAGTSAPLLTTCPMPAFYYYMDDLNLTYFYSGRLGEILGATGETAKINLYADGTEVASSYDEAITYMCENNGAREYKISLTTDNYKIDNLKGGNIAEIIYTKSDDDSCPPSVTMLQFRNRNNEVLQTFNNSSDGELLISAADFELYLDSNNKKVLDVSAPERITTWVTPYGSNSEVLNEIELTECEDLFDSNGLGAFYKASLADVDLSSPTGWFDLTIKVEDAAGNSQVQTVSPAFKIESLTGVTETPADMGVRVIGNHIITPEGSRIYNVNGVETGGNNLPSGVYIVHTPKKTAKVVIR